MHILSIYYAYTIYAYSIYICIYYLFSIHLLSFYYFPSTKEKSSLMGGGHQTTRGGHQTTRGVIKLPGTPKMGHAKPAKFC